MVEGSTSDFVSDFCLLSATGVDVPDLGGLSRSDDSPTIHQNHKQDKILYMSLVMRKPALCICENKDADQLRGNREADQRLCFRYMDSKIPLLSKSEISSL